MLVYVHVILYETNHFLLEVSLHFTFLSYDSIIIIIL